MLHTVTATDFDSWRDQARHLLNRDIPPAHVAWHDTQSEPSLFGFDTPLPRPSAAVAPPSIPKDFIALAQTVACHRDARRWHLLYAAVWRLTHGEKHLLNLVSDPLVRTLNLLSKAVRRDAHKMKAFVRFRLVQADGNDHYVAWHQPDHRVLRLTAPFFQRRFSVMRWSILTPDDSVTWDGGNLHYGPGVPASAAPLEDTWEEMWKTFYGAIFNPARIKIDMMKREMPVRYWHTMPETALIPQLLKDAPDRVAAMVAHQEGLQSSAADYIPARTDYATLRLAARTCRGCPLYCDATQTVFGSGNWNAALMVVGEQPGEQEDRSGLPFVGAAGQLLDRILAAAGIARDTLYVTNAVKHFKHAIDDSTGTRRVIHQTPTVREITACRPWLKTEINLVQPQVILCLGLTAARALLGHGFTLKNQRGIWFEKDGRRILVSYHPAAILRMPDAAHKKLMHDQLSADIALAWHALNPARADATVPAG